MIDLRTTRHLAELSKLEFTEGELEIMADEMSDIVDLMDTIADFTPEGEESFSGAVPYAELREDEAAPSLPRGKVLANAEEKGETCFSVPKVV